MQTFASLSGTHTAAWCSTGFLPPAMKKSQSTHYNQSKLELNIYQKSNEKSANRLLFLNRSSMHLFMWAIHSCFSVLVAAYTANDLVAVLMSHPFRYSVDTHMIESWKFGLIDSHRLLNWIKVTWHHLRPLSSSPCSCTSSNGIICCLLYFFLLITMLPYTRMSLNRKNCLAFGRLRHIFVSTPSPTKTRPTTFNGCKYSKSNQIKNSNRHILNFNIFNWFFRWNSIWRRFKEQSNCFPPLTCPELPKQLSTILIRRAFASLFTAKPNREKTNRQ